MTTEPDAFDLGASAVWEARARGEKLLKTDLARIFRTTYQGFSIEHPQKSAQPAPRKKHPLSGALAKAQFNALFDAFVLFESVSASQLTANGRYKITEAIEQILAVCPELNPEEIAKRGLIYKKLYHNITPTAMGLCSNWDKCGGGPKTELAKRDPYGQPPENWRDYAIKRFPGTLVSATPWLELSLSVRNDILKIIP